MNNDFSPWNPQVAFGSSMAFFFAAAMNIFFAIIFGVVELMAMGIAFASVGCLSMWVSVKNFRKQTGQ